MTDAASITIQIDSRPAVAGARQITEALERIGSASDAASRKVQSFASEARKAFRAAQTDLGRMQLATVQRGIASVGKAFQTAMQQAQASIGATAAALDALNVKMGQATKAAAAFRFSSPSFAVANQNSDSRQSVADGLRDAAQPLGVIVGAAARAAGKRKLPKLRSGFQVAQVVLEVGPSLIALAEELQKVSTNADRVKAKLKELGTAAAAVAIDLAVAAVAMKGLVAVFGPQGGVVVAIGLTVAGLIAFRNELVTLGDHTARTKDFVIAAWEVLGERLRTNWTFTARLLREKWTDFTSAVRDAMQPVVDALQTAWTDIATRWSWLVGKLGKEWGAFVERTKKLARSLGLPEMWDTARTAFTNFTRALLEDTMFGRWLEMMKRGLGQIRDFFGGILGDWKTTGREIAQQAEQMTAQAQRAQRDVQALQPAVTPSGLRMAPGHGSAFARPGGGGFPAPVQRLPQTRFTEAARTSREPGTHPALPSPGAVVAPQLLDPAAVCRQLLEAQADCLARQAAQGQAAQAVRQQAELDGARAHVTRLGEVDGERLSDVQAVQQQLTDVTTSAATRRVGAEQQLLEQLKGQTAEFSQALQEEFKTLALTGEANFRELARSFAQATADMLLQKQLLDPLFAAFGAVLGGGSSSLFASLFGATVGHGGGVLGMDTFTRRTIGADVFAGAPRFARGGLVGGEVPVIAHRGEGIFTPAQMAALGTAGDGPAVQFGDINVTVQFTEGGAAQVSAENASRAGRQLGRAVSAAVTREIQNQMRPGGLLSRA